MIIVWICQRAASFGAHVPNKVVMLNRAHYRRYPAMLDYAKARGLDQVSIKRTPSGICSSWTIRRFVLLLFVVPECVDDADFCMCRQ